MKRTHTKRRSVRELLGVEHGMMQGLTLYAEMTDTVARTSDLNIPWLVVRPSHWSVVRSKRLFSARTERARPDDQQLSATQAYGVIPQAEFERRVGRKVVRITQHLDKRAHVEPDDFVISMRSFQGGLERAWARGCIRSSYVVLRPSLEVHVGYFAHLFKCQEYIRALQATSNFIRDGQDLNLRNFSLVDLPLSPPDEQADIARFLDHTNGKIARFIRGKRKLIGLLNEQKQAIIHTAVTRGLNQNAPLKPSGIPWLDEIPEHWSVTALRRHWRVTDCKHITVPFVEDGIPLASVVEVHSFFLNLTSSKKTTPFWYRLLIEGDRKPRRGDLVYCRNASVGACALVETDIDFAMGQDVCLIRSAKQNQRFLNYLLHSPFMDHQLELLLVGSTFKRINVADIKALSVLVPPRAEQDAICAHLDSRLAVFDTVIVRTEREIALMEEYRTRLTADAVTGKLDVRAAAAKLPEIAPEDSSADESPTNNKELALEEADE